MLLLLALLGCRAPEVESAPELGSGAPVVGAAEGTLDLPVGTPLGGYSSRCDFLGGDSEVDNRKSPYTVAFMPSTGVHTRIGIRALWLSNGVEDFVLLQTDTIYSYDGLVEALTAELEARTGRNLDGRVIHTASHSHQSYGPFSDQVHFYLGGDRYNEEIFRRTVAEIVEVAMQAYGTREPAAIGSGWAKNWDPEDRVYHDRRSDNDTLQMFPDLPPGAGGKDPYLHLLRVDRLDGSPLAVAFTFGVHGTVLDSDNPMISSEASGAIASAVRDAFDTPVVAIHLQGSGGDASPGGVDEGYARLESLGEFAVAPILDLWAATPTSADPIRVETASRHIWSHPSQIEVHRDDRVLRYTPFVADAVPDDVVYDTDGQIATPIDEYNAEFGAAFCGGGDPLISAASIGSAAFPYTSCTDVGTIARIVLAVFDLAENEIPLPFPESMKAGTSASRLGPLLTRLPDGREVTTDLLTGFFPAEPTAMFSEQWRRRVRSEIGDELALLVGYSQDHEGYFLPPEDWLMGGYEPNIALWGPLQGEHVMEGVLDYAGSLLSTTDVVEDPDPWDYYAPTEYMKRELPTEFQPDPTLGAGTLLASVPEGFWTPIPLDLTPRATVPRVGGIVQIAWEGGDPMVDLPRVVLEKEEFGTWNEVRTVAGRPIDDTLGDILTAWTPDPLYPVNAPQTHRWWAAWQAVAHDGEREALPLGTYRLAIHGKRFAGAETAWPRTTESYTAASAPFEVVEAPLAITRDATGVWVSMTAPAAGWRLIDVEGRSRGANPVRGTVSVVGWIGDAPLPSEAVTVDAISDGQAHLTFDLDGIDRIDVTDAFGNTGTLILE